MASNKFKFVSPGVFINEIDQSQVARQPEDIGPVVIGRAIKGPMMRPVKVNTYVEFEELFGSPIPGSSNGDVWREGNKLAPTYGAYAAEAYLTNAGPLTYVRLGGVNAEDQDAGWNVGTPQTNALDISTNAGAYGLFIADTGTPGPGVTNITGSAKLAAIFYVKNGSVGLTGKEITTETDLEDRGAIWVRSTNGQNKEFKLVFTDGTTTKEKFVNFNEDSKNFIRSTLNTNPTKVDADNTTSANKEVYWLGQSFENSITEAFASNDVAGVILALNSPLKSVSGGDLSREATKSSSGWVISQHLEAATSWEYSDGVLKGVRELFKFHTLSEDTWTQNNIKISIQNIKLPANKYTKYGTFSVVLRAMNDTDDQQVVLERFDQCNLDASSPNYLAKKIGDINTTWDAANKRYIEYGNYENQSKYIRVEMNADVDAGDGADLLPFGFYGPTKIKNVSPSAAAAAAAMTISSSSGVLSASFLSAVYGGSNSVTGPKADVAVTASFEFPSVPLVESNASGKHYLKDAKAIYWGVKTTKAGDKKFNKEVAECLRALPAGIEANPVLIEPSFVFSLDQLSGSADEKTVTVVAGSRAEDKSLTAVYEGTDNLAGFLEKYNKFTMPLAGGFEGLDITKKDPFNNAILDVSADEQTNYAYASILRALESVADPEVVEMNALVVPGVKNLKIHNKMLSICETRGDSLAILDLQGDYTPAADLNPDDIVTTPSLQKPSASGSVAYVKDSLVANSSYGCSYFPWVLTADNRDGNKVWIPPSVIALGTFGSTKRFSEVWFAPAGFTRGGLSANNAGGLPVLQVAQKLNSKERDALYEANINPIASFPAEGIVIFGQKTLQATPSALDRINVRRLMNYVKKEISRMAATVLFDQNVDVTWLRFLGMVEPFLAEVKSGLGLTEFKVVLDETTTTPELVDRNILYAKIFLKPARAIEYIALDFTITNSGASFAD